MGGTVGSEGGVGRSGRVGPWSMGCRLSEKICVSGHESCQVCKMVSTPDFVDKWKAKGWKFFYFFSGMHLLEKLPTLATAKSAHYQGKAQIEKLGKAAIAVAAYCPSCFGVEAVAAHAHLDEKKGKHDALRRLCSAMNKHADMCKGKPARLVRAL